MIYQSLFRSHAARYQSLFHRPNRSRFLYWSTRGGAIILLVGLFLLLRHLLDLGNQYGAGTFVKHNVYKVWHGWGPDGPSSANHTNKKLSKVVVAGRLRSQDETWITEAFPDWQSAIYVVDPDDTTSKETPTTPFNGAHEATPYLTYIIDNYKTLPDIAMFIHIHHFGWHIDSPLKSNVQSLRSLNLNYVQEQGYVNLRCNINPGCHTKEMISQHVTPEVWRRFFEGSGLSYSIKGRNNTDIGAYPEDGKLGAVCCAQFAVSSERIRERPKSDYVKMRLWIKHAVKDGMEDAKSGRIFEFLWHVIFGMPAVHCPDSKKCYCEVLGQCDV